MMKTQNSISFVILAAILTTAIGILPLTASNIAFSQTNATTSNSTGMNMTIEGGEMTMRHSYDKPMMGMGMDHKEYEKINGTLNLMETMYQAIESKFNVSLADAITTAEQTVGNGSYAMSANGEEKDGFLVYSVILGSPDMKFTKVLVDPGNGSVLQTKNISMMEWMMMMHPQGHRDMSMKEMHGSPAYGGSSSDYDKWSKNQGSGW